MQPRRTRDTLLADRIRAVACVVLKTADERLTIAEVVTGIRRLGIPLRARHLAG